jgi:hypothetical protein
VDGACGIRSVSSDDVRVDAIRDTRTEAAQYAEAAAVLVAAACKEAAVPFFLVFFFRCAVDHLNVHYDGLTTISSDKVEYKHFDA